jgi:RNA polymerase sigma factor (sigma-70 family)
MTDGELVKRRAFGDLAQRYTPLVRAVCQARVWRTDVVPDLVQETFLRGLQHLDSLQEPERFGSWLLGIARNLCRQWRRDRENRQLCFSDVPRSADGQPDVRLDPPVPGEAERDDHHDLWAAVRQLPLPLRETLLLYYSKERITYAQIAALLKVSPATVNKRLTRARERLRRLLRP